MAAMAVRAILLAVLTYGNVVRAAAILPFPDRFKDVPNPFVSYRYRFGVSMTDTFTFTASSGLYDG